MTLLVLATSLGAVQLDIIEDDNELLILLINSGEEKVCVQEVVLGFNLQVYTAGSLGSAASNPPPYLIEWPKAFYLFPGYVHGMKLDTYHVLELAGSDHVSKLRFSYQSMMADAKVGDCIPSQDELIAP